MANLCDNRFYFCCEHNADKYINALIKIQSEPYFIFEFEIIDKDDDYCCIEGYFESKWTFPIELFDKEFLPNVENDPDECYFRCLSEEYGSGYVAMNIYSNSEWWDEQTFNL